MGLEDYQQKRNFEKTPEPEGKKENSNQHRFVIQRHDARRLHYDLRLEIRGLLKSWAVPKGPSMNPKDKRLAVHTEDHPIKYLSFQGTIPKGNYGAGDMSIWDQGTFTSYKSPENPEQIIKEYETGTLHLALKGQKLKGKFTLVRTNYGTKNHWLLMKQKDEYAIETSYDAEDYQSPMEDEVEVEESIFLDDIIPPMLAIPAQEPFDAPDWLFELKYDGYRIIANIQKNQVKLYSRNGISYDEKFSEVHKELSSLLHKAILDGEMIVVDSDGRPQFHLLQNYDSSTKGSLRYMVFDLLYLNGHSLLELPLTDRKELLRDLLPDMEYVKYCEHIMKDGRSLYQEAVNQGLEGILAKRKDSFYHPGRRSEDWLKIKPTQTADPVICGYTRSEKSGRPFGSLILGVVRDSQLHYSGNCGTGFSHQQMNVLIDHFQSLIQPQSPFSDAIDLKQRIPQWLSPELVCEIKYSEITSDGRYRHPVFLRLRPDKKRSQTRASTALSSSSADSTDIADLEINGISISLSNLEKIYWPESGLRKYDLLDYYIAMSDVILPYLVDRPQSLHRHPDGITKPGFYQKDQENLPEWVATTEIHSQSTNKDINYLLCQNEATLLYMVNLGCIEINPWLSRIGDIDHPDYSVIDLDPSPTNTFDQVIETALIVKEVLDQAGIQGYPKTSGSRGIHIYIPMAAEYSFDQARDFVHLLCIMVQNKLPEMTTLERSLKKRGSKIYLDYLQNRRGQTIAAPYSVRPVPGAHVSAPVTWKELEQGFALKDFNIHTMSSRIAKKGDLFSTLLKSNTNMKKTLDKLNTTD